MSLISRRRLLENTAKGGLALSAGGLIAACGSAYRLDPQTDWQGQTVTLTIEAVPAPEPCKQPETKRVGSPQLGSDPDGRTFPPLPADPTLRVLVVVAGVGSQGAFDLDGPDFL